MMTSANKKGQMDFTMRSMLILPAPHATFNTVPTGGVNNPITVIKINTTPKYATSIKAFTTFLADCLSAFVRLSFLAMKNHNTHWRKKELMKLYPEFFVNNE